jgi:alkylation response protein AidB-like acyl-CoA dehydrogenase
MTIAKDRFMNFDLSEEQVLLKEAVTRFLRDRYSLEERRRIAASSDAFSPALWNSFAQDLGILGAVLPEATGGLGGGAIETMIIMEALGEALVLEPYLETAVIGGGFLKRAATESARKMLGEIVAGNVRVAFAAAEPTARYAWRDVSTVARWDGESWLLSGTKTVVSAAPVATHLIVSARTTGAQRDCSGISLFLTEANVMGLAAHAYRTIDDRRAADLVFDRVRVPADALLGEEGNALPIIEQVMDEATAAVSAEAVGAMRRLLHDTIDYAKQRRQFGQPIAQFQVLQHRMVDMYMALEQAVSAVYLATLKLDQPAQERARAVSAAKATIGRSGRFIGQNAIQIHGAMGMTDELSVGNYFKRLTAIENEFGTVDHHLARYAALSQANAV